jgi:iron uptake system component EfeO
VRDIALAADEESSALVTELDEQFAAMKNLLLTYGNYEDGFVFYDTVTQTERNELGARLNALSEPLSQLTHAVLGVDPTE